MLSYFTTCSAADSIPLLVFLATSAKFPQLMQSKTITILFACVYAT